MAVDPASGSDSCDKYIAMATQLITTTQIGLEAKGYPPGLTGWAIDRAVGTALKKVEHISPTIRNQAYYDILGHELAGAEPWILKMQALANEDKNGTKGGE